MFFSLFILEYEKVLDILKKCFAKHKVFFFSIYFIWVLDNIGLRLAPYFSCLLWSMELNLGQNSFKNPNIGLTLAPYGMGYTVRFWQVGVQTQRQSTDSVVFLLTV